MNCFFIDFNATNLPESRWIAKFTLPNAPLPITFPILYFSVKFSGESINNLSSWFLSALLASGDYLPPNFIGTLKKSSTLFWISASIFSTAFFSWGFGKNPENFYFFEFDKTYGIDYLIKDYFELGVYEVILVGCLYF